MTRIRFIAIVFALTVMGCGTSLPKTNGSTRIFLVTHGYPEKQYKVYMKSSNWALNLAMELKEVTELKPSVQPIASFSSAKELATSDFVAASALASKAKQVDDGLYAAVELAVDKGLGLMPSRVEFISKLARALVGSEPGAGRTAAASLLVAASKLGGLDGQGLEGQGQWPAEILQAADVRRKAFLLNTLASRPIGFYTWSEGLMRIFKRDRMLQNQLEPPAALAMARVLGKKGDLLRSYVKLLKLLERLTNPLTWADLSKAAAVVSRGGSPGIPKKISLFPPSRSHEADLVERVFEQRRKDLARGKRVQFGMDVMGEMIQRIRDGRISLKPRRDSGWYDHQTYALEPLVIPDLMPEAKMLGYNEGYKKALLGLFKSLVALTRETHIKQLHTPVTATSAPPGPRRKEPIHLFIEPELGLEPLATYYLRRAYSYRFIRRLLDRTFGTDALKTLRRQTAGGPVKRPLVDEIRWMEDLYHGAYLTVLHDLRMQPVQAADLGSGLPPSRIRARFVSWWKQAGSDPDLKQDVRIMVPLYHDEDFRKTKVLVVLGYRINNLDIDFAVRPRVAGVVGPEGRTLDRSDYKVHVRSRSVSLVRLLTREIYVKEILDRETFRKVCDKHKTVGEILKNLR